MLWSTIPHAPITSLFNDVEINRKTPDDPCKIVAGKRKEAAGHQP